jgi:hypothetical protein
MAPAVDSRIGESDLGWDLLVDQRCGWQHNPTLAGYGDRIVGMGATRFRRKLSRPEGMPAATCPLSGGKLELATLRCLWLPRQT